jgi:hypothetical protein
MDLFKEAYNSRKIVLEVFDHSSGQTETIVNFDSSTAVFRTYIAMSVVLGARRAASPVEECFFR